MPPFTEADLLFRGGPMLDAWGRPAYDRVVVVHAGRIAAVGPQDEVDDLVGPRTEVVELAGRLLVPGFQDAHVHPVQGGAERLRCDLTGLGTLEHYVQAVATYAASHPDEPWILGGGWELAAFPGGTPSRHTLDAAVSDRPAYLPNRDHHGAWVNSRALELARITRETPDPADGRIERDRDGEPTGTLHEGAVALVYRVLPEETLDDLVAGLLEGQRHLHSVGVTGWQDAIVGAYLGHGDPFEAYREVERRGLLTARVRGALWWERDRGLEQLDHLRERRAVTAGSRFTTGAVKVMVDGIAENFTAAMLDPYLDSCGCSTDNRGIAFVESARLADYVAALDADGFQVHVHAIGDRAVRQSLDAFEHARTTNGPGRPPGRHHLAHLQLVHPDDVPRFAPLQVTATMQALWACHEPQMDELTIPFLGPERSTWQYPFGSLARSGARLVTKTWSAVDLVKAGSEALGGKGGGGRADMAQAGGPDGAKAGDALAAIEARLAG